MLDRRLILEGRSVGVYLIISIVLGMGIALLAVAQAWYFSQVVAGVFLSGVGLGEAQSSLLIILGIIVLRTLLQWLSEISSHQAASRIKQSLRQRLMEHIADLGPLYVRGEKGGELITTTVEGIEALEDYFSKYVPQLILAVGIPLIILGFVFPADWKSGLILLVTGPLIPVFMILIGKLAEKKSLRQWRQLSWMSAHFLDVLRGLTTLKVFGKSKTQVRVVKNVSDAFRRSTLSVLRVAFLSALVLEFLATISTALVAVTIGLRLVYDTISYSSGLFLLLLAPEFYTPLRALGLNFHAGMSGINAAARIFEVLDLPVTNGLVRNESQTRELSSPFDITFQHVSLTYTNGEPAALKDIELEIHPGEKLAIVGPSGAGKTSLVQLLLRFNHPTEGQILINGVSLNEIAPQTWWNQIAYVPQTPHLFKGSVAENILMGRPAAAFEEVVKAAKDALAHEFIEKLPDKYQTLLGEGGARLSSGQIQRLALARAFLKDAPLLILDEGTSNLDMESEFYVQQALTRLLKEKTAIVIAHRLDTISKADRILVMNQGEIIEEGNHEALIQREGLYYRLLKDYRGESQ